MTNHLYASVLASGEIEFSREECNNWIVADYKAAMELEKNDTVILWGAGFGGENDAESPAKLPLYNPSKATKAQLVDATGKWEAAANHPATKAWATESYVQYAMALAQLLED